MFCHIMEKNKYFELVVSSLSRHQQKVDFQGRECIEILCNNPITPYNYHTHLYSYMRCKP